MSLHYYGFVAGGCFPRNLTLNLTVRAMRSSRPSSLGVGICARAHRVPCLGKPALRSSNSVLLAVLVVFRLSFVVVSVSIPCVFSSFIFYFSLLWAYFC